MPDKEINKNYFWKGKNDIKQIAAITNCTEVTSIVLEIK